MSLALRICNLCIRLYAVLGELTTTLPRSRLDFKGLLLGIGLEKGSEGTRAVDDAYTLLMSRENREQKERGRKETGIRFAVAKET